MSGNAKEDEELKAEQAIKYSDEETPSLKVDGRDHLGEILGNEYKDVVDEWPGPSKLPLVYSNGYNISFGGLAKLLTLAKLQTMDAWKFDNVVAALQKEGLLSRNRLVRPVEAPLEALSDVHSSKYLEELANSRWRVIQVTELPGLTLLPNLLVQHCIMRPLRLHAAGTILAAGLAYERGWAINVGGGMHHASRDHGAGWCAYDDITLACRRLRKATQGKVQKIMVVDLDAHQGNGYQKDKLFFEDQDMFVVDVYNSMIFPRDEEARKGIDVEKQLKCGTSGEEYISCVQEALVEAGARFTPDLIMYNAGSDVFEEDYTGRLKVSWKDVIQRDELVFGHAQQRQTPICMMLAGGYGAQNAALIAESIGNLMKKFNLC